MKNVEATVVVFRPPLYPPYFKEVRVVPMKPIPYLPRLKELIAVPQVFTTLVKAVRRERIDILLALCADSAEGMATPLAARLASKPCVIRVTGNDIIVSARRYPFLVKPPLTLCDAVVASTEYMRNLTLFYLPNIKHNKIKIIPIGVDVEVFSPKRDDSEIRAKYGLGDVFTVLTICRLVKRKGVHYLLQAIHEVLKEDPEVRLIILGDGPERQTLMELAKSLSILQNVIFEKYVPEKLLPAYYAACDVFALPSIVDNRDGTESFGIVFAEAMACGKPVIGTKVGGIPYLIEHEKNGLLVAQRSATELASAILKLKNDSKLRRRMGIHGRHVIEKKYSWQVALDMWMELFRKVSDQYFNTKDD